MTHFGKLQHGAFLVALSVAALLLVRFALDLTDGMSIYLAAPFWLLVVVSLAVSIANLFSREAENLAEASRWQSGLLLAAVPLGFVVSSLDCAGLGAEGCSSFCTFIRIGWTPLIAALALTYYLSEKKKRDVLRQRLILIMLAASFVPLAPHCVCYNAGNAWWIDRIGASPTCYAWGFMVTLISLGALHTGARLWLSISVCAAIIGGGLAFFVGHHYFHFPW